MELELSRVCNLQCRYCYASSGQPLENELTLSEICSVIDQARELGAQKIIVLGGGEPLLYPHLFQVIDHIIDCGLEVDLFTNGVLINRETAEALFKRNVAVSMKMNSRRAEVQDDLAGKKGTFVKIEEGLQNLLDAGYPDDKHTLGVETIICQQNYDEMEDLWRWARNLGIIPYVEAMTMQGRATEHNDLEVAPARVQQLFDRLAVIDSEEFGRNWIPHPPLVASQCARHEYSCTITSVGEVNPCPGVNVDAGNIREHSLADILRSSTVISDLRNIRQNIKGECAECEINDYCYGCRGHAFQVTGDYLAEDPLCWLKNGQKIKLLN